MNEELPKENKPIEVNIPKEETLPKKIAALEVMKQLKLKRAILLGAFIGMAITTLSIGQTWLNYIRYGAFIASFAGFAIFFVLNEQFIKRLQAKYMIK